MKSLRSFKNLHPIIEQSFNIPIKNDDDVEGFKTDIDKSAMKKLLKYLSASNYSDIPIAGASTGKIKIRGVDDSEEASIRKWIEDNFTDGEFKGKRNSEKFSFGNGSIGKGGQKIPPDVQEIMVAALVLNKVTSKGNISVEEADKIIEDAKKTFPKVVGVKGKETLLDLFNGNYNDLATAISSSNAILQIVKNPMKVYWPAQSWDKEIKHFNPPIGGIKDYNSSDVVVKSGDGKFYGFSLKKKARAKDSDPTLINKAVTGRTSLIRDVLGDSHIEVIENAKNTFFDYVVKQQTGKSAIEVNKMSEKDRSDIIKKVPVKKMGMYLKSPTNIFFKKMYAILTQYADEFMKEFLSLIFRAKMDQVEKAGEFKFYLLTGVGRFIKGELEVDKADVIDTPQVVETLTKLFSTNLRLVPTKGRKQAWDKDSKGAKVYVTIESDGQPMVYIEIRYKGSYTKSTSPQFQATASPVMKNIFKGKA